METATVDTRELKIVREPKVYLVGRQSVSPEEIARFLADEEVSWQTDTEVGAERLAELAGRVCYMSYGKGRKTNEEFLSHLIDVGHGSVLEHGVWSFLITGASRSFTHELIRHRHFSYSQLSQRYVDESDSDFIEPDVIADDPVMHAAWCEAVNAARKAYDTLVAGLEAKFTDVPEKTLRDLTKPLRTPAPPCDQLGSIPFRRGSASPTIHARDSLCGTKRQKLPHGILPRCPRKDAPYAEPFSRKHPPSFAP